MKDRARRGVRAREAKQVELALRQYEDPLLRYAASIVGADLAGDVVQDAFLRLWAADPVPCDGRVMQWLFTVCRNRAIDIRRKQGRMSPSSPAQLTAANTEDEGPPAVAERHETTDRVLQLLRSLPKNQEEALRLKFQNGFSYRQIADITGKSVSNVGFLIHTAIQNLRKKLNPGS